MKIEFEKEKNQENLKKNNGIDEEENEGDLLFA